MCEFEGLCVFEDTEDCNKEDPEECFHWWAMMDED